MQEELTVVTTQSTFKFTEWKLFMGVTSIIVVLGDTNYVFDFEDIHYYKVGSKTYYPNRTNDRCNVKMMWIDELGGE